MSAAPRIITLAAPTSVDVRTNACGTPMAVARRRRWVRVASEHERWQIDDEWWRQPVSRSYHVVALEDGTLLTLYRDRTNGQWFLQK